MSKLTLSGAEDDTRDRCSSSTKKEVKQSGADPFAPLLPTTGSDAVDPPFFGILHVIACLCVLVLVFYSAFSIHLDKTRQAERKSLAKKAAFVYLASSRPRDLANLKYSLHQLDTNFNAMFEYRVVIVHENISLSEQNALQEQCTSHLEFRNVSLELPEESQGTLNLSAIQPTFRKRGEWNYQNMCRFWFQGIISPGSPLHDVDFAVRLDTDSAFTAPIERDFIFDFIASGRQYGYNKIEKSCDESIVVGLKDTILQFVELNKIRPLNVDLWAMVVRNRKSPCVPTFYNNFEVLDLRFFRTHAGVKDLVHIVEENGGLYRNGWGDGALRFLTVALYIPTERTISFPKSQLPYIHPHPLGNAMLQNATNRNALGVGRVSV